MIAKTGATPVQEYVFNKMDELLDAVLNLQEACDFCTHEQE
jgi:hypothetical protein